MNGLDIGGLTVLRFHTCDVFTDTPYTGNPLAIVEGADGLTTAQMQMVAREFNLSETIFVQAPDDPAHTAKVRIFFPTAEIPFAGHPTIGCAIHLARAAHAQGDFEAHIKLEEVAGLVPVQVRRTGERIVAEFTAPKIPTAAGTLPDVQDLAAALGLMASAVGPHNPGVWEGGPTFLYVPVRSIDDLAKAKPHEPAFTTLLETASAIGAYVYAPVKKGYRARMFGPAGDIPEDPATGSASAILSAQLLANKALSDGTTQLSLTQGVEMGRRSDIRLTVDVSANAISAIRVAGSAVPISSGQIAPPT